jgi:hypothetical protein
MKVIEPAVDTLAILTEKFQGSRSIVNSLQAAFAGIECRNRAKMVLQDRRAFAAVVYAQSGRWQAYRRSKW